MLSQLLICNGSIAQFLRRHCLLAAFASFRLQSDEERLLLAQEFDATMWRTLMHEIFHRSSQVGRIGPI